MADLALVTGGTGFVGGWCVARLLEQGHHVRATVRSPGRTAAVTAAMESRGLPTDRLSFAVADLDDDAGWAEAMAESTGCSTWPRRWAPTASRTTPTSWSGPRSRDPCGYSTPRPVRAHAGSS